MLNEAGLEHPHLAASLTGHQQQFGHPPWLRAGDRGVVSPTNETRAEPAGVKRIVLAVVGNATPEPRQRERTGWGRRGFRFRTGIEGRRSVLRRCYGLDRCRDHGEDSLGRWVGWGIVTANLATTARTVAPRSAAPAARASGDGTHPLPWRGSRGAPSGATRWCIMRNATAELLRLSTFRTRN